MTSSRLLGILETVWAMLDAINSEDKYTEILNEIEEAIQDLEGK